jgi:hypothetical protein
MKKVIILVLALCLAVPAMSYAGSASSRWDLLIGGNIKMDMGWVDSKVTGDITTDGVPARDDRSGFSTIDNKYGNQIWGGGQASINFVVRGPDAWGAKTSAFLLGDFTGVRGGSTYGSFDMLVATMTFDWANTSLMFGDSGSAFGILPTHSGGNQSSYNAIGIFGDKGAIPILTQITLTQRFSKEWTAKFGIMANANNTRNYNNFPVAASNSDFAAARATTPGIQGGVTYSSDACGKVGPWRMTFGTSGGLIRQKQAFQNGNFANSEDTPGWLADFKMLIPIIPQDKNGNKTHALYFDATAWTGQNFDGFHSGFSGAGTAAYNRGTSRNPDFGSLVNSGVYTHAAFYFTDALWINGFYMYAKHDSSDVYKSVINRNVVNNVYQSILSLCYDVNPAVRMTVQWDHTYAKYANATPGFRNVGNQNSFLYSAYYYF